MPWPTSGRCCASWTSAVACPPRSSRWRSAWAPGRARRSLARPLPRAGRGARHRVLSAAALPARRLLDADARIGRSPRSRGTATCVSVMPMDALNPLKTLSFLRYKVLYVHLTNVYDNLAVRRARAPRRPPLPGGGAGLAAAAAAAAPGRGLRRARRGARARRAERLLERGQTCSAIAPGGWRSGARCGMACAWRSGCVGLADLAQAPLPPGLDLSHLEDLLRGAPDDVRFHVSRGAAESFVNTLPLLHPRGYLQVQDIFVTTMGEYRHGLPGTRQARWLGGHLGQRRAAPRGGRPGPATTSTSRPSATGPARAPPSSTPPSATEQDVQWPDAAAPHRRGRQLLDAGLARARQERLPPAPDQPPRPRRDPRPGGQGGHQGPGGGRGRRGLRRRAAPRQHDRPLRPAAARRADRPHLEEVLLRLLRQRGPRPDADGRPRARARSSGSCARFTDARGPSSR